jgi:hypothetical protein
MYEILLIDQELYVNGKSKGSKRSNSPSQIGLIFCTSLRFMSLYHPGVQRGQVANTGKWQASAVQLFSAELILSYFWKASRLKPYHSAS